MSFGTSKARAKRLAAIELAPTRWGQAVANLQRRDVELRLLVLLLFLIAVALILRIWKPPFPYYSGYLVDRDVVSRVNFQIEDQEGTERAKEEAKNQVLYIFEKTDRSQHTLTTNLDELRVLLQKVYQAQSFEALRPDERENFEPQTEEIAAATRARSEIGEAWNFLRSRPEKQRPPTSPPPETPSASGGTPETPPVREEAPPTSVTGVSSSTSSPAVTENKHPAAKVTIFPGSTQEKIVWPGNAKEMEEMAEDEKKNPPNEEAVTPSRATDTTDTPREKAPEAAEEESHPKTESIKTVETVLQKSPEAAESTGAENAGAAVPEIALSDRSVDHLCEKIAAIMMPFERNGLMHSSAAKEDPLLRGIQHYVDIHDEYDSEMSPLPEGVLGIGMTTGTEMRIRKRVDIRGLIIEGNADILAALQNELGEEVGDRIYHYVCRNWKSNLRRNSTLTDLAVKEAGKKVPEVFTQYVRSQRLVETGLEGSSTTGVNLTPAMVSLLRAENDAWLAQRTTAENFHRFIAAFFVLLTMTLPTVCFIAFMEPQIIARWKNLLILLATTLAALVLAIYLSTDSWRFTLLPLVFYSQLITIQYQRRIGLVAGYMMATIVAFGLGTPLSELFLYYAVILVSVLPLDRIRGRFQFIKIGFAAACVAFCFSYCNDALFGQPADNFHMTGASFHFMQLLLGGFLLQGFIPVLEKWLGILSDARLMELCDLSDPLLSKLVDSAPSTYSHSVAVGAIGERAAEAINCDGLLVRAASYYHDIGKIYKPDYYMENQSVLGVNHHQELEPTMSALVIIAHIKNGVDLARQHNLPEQIIDIIEQHHGTTLVKYFYSEAVRRNGGQQDHSPVEESPFSYPGPKPQTKEAVIVMLADSCESACRAITDPTPRRIEGLVGRIVQERLEEGQFDDTSMTLRELRAVEDSIAKSLISNYHGRMKYPEMKK